MNPSDVLRQIRSEHDFILELVDKCRKTGTHSLESMSVVTTELVTFMLGHMHREEAELLPALRENSNWAAVNVADMKRHHKEQRASFEQLGDAIAKAHDVTPELAALFAQMIEGIETDVHEENELILTPGNLYDEPESDGFGA